jgi:FHS family glucose/mannose:H+ symporter-like MFS transporter
MSIFRVQIAQKKWAIFFAFLSLFLLGLADNIRGPLFPEILDFFNISSSKGALSFATTSGAAFVGSFLSGYYLQKFSISSLLLLAVFTMATGLAVMGIAPNFDILLIGSFGLGLSIGFMGVSQNLLVTENVSAENQSKALSGLHAMYGFASFLAPVIAAQTTIYFGVWRAAFIATAILCVIFLLIQCCIHPNPIFLATQKIKTEDQKNIPISKKALMFMGGLFGFYVVAEILISTRLAQYMRTYFDMNLQQSSSYVTYFFICLLAGRLFFAFKKFSIPIRQQMNYSLTVSIVFLILGLNVHPFFLVLVGLGMAPYYPLSVAYISEYAGIHTRSFITFAMSFQSLAVISMHLGVGYLTDHLGLFYAFGVGVFALVLSWICLNYHPREIRVSSK